MSKAAPKLPPITQNPLSLACEGAVPTFLRMIADKIEANEADAEQVNLQVATHAIVVGITLNLRGGPGR